jgi:large subunit ribosomal protein L23
MALFSRKKKTAPDNKSGAKSETSKASASAAKSSDKNTNPSIRSKRPVLLGMRITEKSVIQNENGVYTLDVARGATKSEIKQALKRIHDVDAMDIRVVNHPGKVKRRGNKLGRTARSRKAYVQLAAGQSIELA